MMEVKLIVKLIVMLPKSCLSALVKSRYPYIQYI